MSFEDTRRKGIIGLVVVVTAITVVFIGSILIVVFSNELIGATEYQAKWNMTTTCNYAKPEVCCECTTQQYGYCCENRADDDSLKEEWCMRTECNREVTLSTWIIVVSVVIVLLIAIIPYIVLAVVLMALCFKAPRQFLKGKIVDAVIGGTAGKAKDAITGELTDLKSKTSSATGAVTDELKGLTDRI